MFVKLLVSGLVIGSIYALIALGYALIYKASGLMSFAQGDMLIVGAYLGLLFYRYIGLSFFLSVVLTTLLAFCLGLLLERGIIRVLMNKGTQIIYIVLATIAFSYILQNTAQAAFGAVVLYFPSVFGTSTVKIAGLQIQPEAIMAFVVGVILMIILHFFMTKTKFGTAMRAASMNKMAAESCGINTSLTTGIAWGLAAALASIGGILLGPMYGVYTSLGAFMGKKGFAGAVVGGYGNMYGAMLGAMILGITETMVAGYIDAGYRNLFAYILLLVFLFIRPTGIFNERAIQDV